MEILLRYALAFVGTLYRWGGDDPSGGYDCSGFVQELLASVGLDPPGDQTAQGLFNHFEKGPGFNKYGLGALAFYGQSVTKITHIAFMVDNYRVIEAGGGGSKTLTAKDAEEQNAYIRIRPLKHRKDLVAIIKPSYHTIGFP